MPNIPFSLLTYKDDLRAVIDRMNSNLKLLDWAINKGMLNDSNISSLDVTKIRNLVVPEIDVEILRAMWIEADNAVITNLEAQIANIDVVISNTTVTNILSAEKGNIAELTVDSIETSDFVQRYLAEDTTPVGYWKGYDQSIDFYEAVIGGNVQTPYRRWLNYPDSPELTSVYPYQCVVESWTGSVYKTYIFLSDGKFYDVVTANRIRHSGTIGKKYVYNGTGWEVPSTLAANSDTPCYAIYEANEDIYTDNTFTAVYFAKTQEPSTPSEPVQIRNRKNELVYWTDVTHTVTTIVPTAFPVMRYTYNGPDGVGVVKLKIHHAIDPVTGYATPEMVWGQGEGVGDNQKGFIYKDNDGLKMEYVDTDGKFSGIQIGSFVDANMRRLKSCAINKTAGTVTVVGEGQTAGESIVIGMTVATDSVTYTWPDGHIATVTIN